MHKNVLQYLENNKKHFLEELIGWLKIPSISTLSQHRQDVHAAAAWALAKLQSIGFPQTEMVEGDGHPLIYGEWLVDRTRPTLLVYGHYDVQPVDPIELWNSNPFDPVVANGNIYARGATDDKGQVMLVLAAIEAWAKTTGQTPVNIKILLEGEEEAGGAFVTTFVESRLADLEADCALICDTHMNSPEEPSIICGLRGILYTELRVHGPKVDLHSGSYGGVAPNPLHALCLLLSRLKGEDGKIDIPELYHSPVAVVAEEKEDWQRQGDRLRQRLQVEMGVDTLFGENDILPQERLGVRPTLEINGISGGFTAEGAKTVIPAEAMAKVSLRLPSTVEPTQAFAAFTAAVNTKMPAGYRVDIRCLHQGRGVSIHPENPYIQAAVAAIEQGYGKRPIFMREGGSIPIAALFDSQLQIPVVLMGFGLPDDGAHSPNEKFSLSQFYTGMRVVADFLGRLQH